MAFARSALSYLQSAYNLFYRVSENEHKAKILPKLHRLKERAESALSGASLGDPSRMAFSSENEELSLLNGKARLVSLRSSAAPSSPPGGSSPPAQFYSSAHSSMRPFNPELDTWSLYSQPGLTSMANGYTQGGNMVYSTMPGTFPLPNTNSTTQVDPMQLCHQFFQEPQQNSILTSMDSPPDLSQSWNDFTTDFMYNFT